MSNCPHLNGYESVQDNATVVHKCLDCGDVIGASAGFKKLSYEDLLDERNTLEADNIRLIQQRAKDAETIDHLRRTSCKCPPMEPKAVEEQG